MMNIYPYKPGSNGAKNIAAALGIKCIAHKNSKFKGAAHKVVINWGASELPPEVEKCSVYNVNSGIASNKLHTFNALKGQPYCLPFVTTKEEAARWFEKEGTKVVCRTLLTAHSGKGIVIAETKEQLVKAPLYTLYIPKKDEYRVHVAFGEVIHVQRKARKLEVPIEKVNWLIRNHENGFIFQQEGFVAPQCVLEAAIDSVARCELDFGGVDVCFNEKQGKAYVLEINTAPGIEGTTVEKYKEAFERLR